MIVDNKNLMMDKNIIQLYIYKTYFLNTTVLKLKRSLVDIARQLQKGGDPLRTLLRSYPALDSRIKTNHDAATVEVARGILQKHLGSLKSMPLTSSIGPSTSVVVESQPGSFVPSKNLNLLIQDMHEDMEAGHDVLLVGGRGAGKTAVVNALASQSQQPLVTMPLFKDMTARDLLQRRGTDKDGTAWIDSPLVTCARNGGILVLDGIHRISQDVLNTLVIFCTYFISVVVVSIVICFHNYCSYSTHVASIDFI
jgi:hypothetical protein